MADLVTVIGGSGFVGRYVVRALARAGYRVRVAVRRPHLAGDLRVHGDVGQIEPVKCSVHRPADLENAIQGADAVVYLPGVLHERGHQNFDELSHQGAEAAAQAAKNAGAKRFVLVSAIGADTKSPSRYGQAKAKGEEAVRAIFKSAVILRPSIVFGPEDDFFNRFGKMATQAPALPLINGGKTKFQPVYVGDVAEAVVRAISTEAAAGKTYELGGPQTYSFKALMEIVLQETQRDRWLLPLPSFIVLPIGFCLALMARMIPFSPPITHDQVQMLKRDNVTGRGAKGLKDLGVSPTALEVIVPQYLVRFRPQGQYSPSRISRV